MTALLNPGNFDLNVNEEDDDSSKSLTEDFNLNEFFDKETKPGCYSEHEKLTQPEWELNVLVRFNINPASAIEFEEDSRSKRLIVTKTRDGLDLLKGLPILAVDEQDVTNLDCFLLEEMLVDRRPPLVMKFGFEKLDADRSSEYSIPSYNSFEDHISFLGNTTSVTYEDIDKNTNRRYSTLEVVEEEHSKDFGVMPDDEKLDEQYELQPISLEGTHGDMSNWSKKCKERAKIISELLDTEKSYIKGLEELKDKFLTPYVEPLQKSLHIDISHFKTKVESLICLHDNIYEKFCSAENICKVFQQEFKFLKIYASYVKGYEETFSILREASKKRGFKTIFEGGEGRAFQDPLGYFNKQGITIVQRPPRYILLLKQLIKNTPSNHPMYYDLEKGLTEIEGTCGSINEFERKNEFKFIEIARSIDNKTLCLHGVTQLVVPSRRLIREGAVGIKTVKQSRLSFIRRGNQERLTLEMGRIVMCNDMLIIMYGKKNRVIRVFMLSDIEADVKKEPRKPSNTNKHFEKVYEVVLKQKSVNMSDEHSEERVKSKYTLREHRRKETLGLAQASTTSFRGLPIEDWFTIYLSTMEEAECWKEAIVKYSSVQYVI